MNRCSPRRVDYFIHTLSSPKKLEKDPTMVDETVMDFSDRLDASRNQGDL